MYGVIHLGNFYLGTYYNVILPVLDGTGNTTHFCTSCSLTLEEQSRMKKASSYQIILGLCGNVPKCDGLY